MVTSVTNSWFELTIYINLYSISSQRFNMNLSEHRFQIVIALGLLIGILVYFLSSKRGRTKKMIAELINRKHINHNTIILTFMLPNFKNKLPLKPGQHLQIQHKINGDIVRRKYTPISDLNRIGSFDLMVRVFHPCEIYPEGGKMSSALNQLSINSKVKITYPYGRVIYEGKTIFKTTDVEGDTKRRKFKNVYMMAAGTGITSMFQFIRYFCEKESESSLPNVTLVYSNKSDMNILMQKQLRGYTCRHSKLKIIFNVDKVISGQWDGMQGYIDEKKIMNTVFSEIDETIYLFAGSMKVYTIFYQTLTERLNISHYQIYRF